MIETIGLIASAICAFVAAAWLHEVTHAVAARALGGEVVEMDLVNLYVDFRFDEPSPVRTRLVLLAPAIVGIVVGVIAVIVLRPGVGVASGVAAVSWVIYTLNGGADGELAIARTSTHHQ